MDEKEIVTIEFDDGTYTGEVLDGKPHGHGKIVYDSFGSTTYYEGGWQNGKYHGRGKLVIEEYSDFRKNLRSWEGEWVNGDIPYGIFIGSDESVYEGELKKRYPHGVGKKKWYAGTYEGEWKDGQMHGKGKRVFYGGKIWEGQMKEGCVHGKGTFTSDKGWVFTGEYFDIPQNSHGKGKIVFPNGDVYDGEVSTTFGVENLDMHGKGTYTYADGRVLKDEFTYGKSNTERQAEWEAKKAEEKRLEQERLEAERREAEERAKDPVAYDAAKKKAYRESLEEKCKALYGSETDIHKRYAILKEAHFQAFNSGFNDHMAWELASGKESSGTSFWQEACRLKYEVRALCDIYKEELGEEE